ncbi:hypothetical protein B0H10DRAFT_2005869 [Mycena sp. CBHHK59/15]|nr:hypothetical protein B0H10DRAFT_2005869 [Mycena sp. CBHHK59/15]
MSLTFARATVSASLRPRAIHAVRRYAHAEYQHIPFSTENERAFAAKFVSFLSLGFAFPCVAMGWQWHKPVGLKNP